MKKENSYERGSAGQMILAAIAAVLILIVLFYLLWRDQSAGSQPSGTAQNNFYHFTPLQQGQVATQTPPPVTYATNPPPTITPPPVQAPAQPKIVTGQNIVVTAPFIQPQLVETATPVQQQQAQTPVQQPAQVPETQGTNNVQTQTPYQYPSGPGFLTLNDIESPTFETLQPNNNDSESLFQRVSGVLNAAQLDGTLPGGNLVLGEFGLAGGVNGATGGFLGGPSNNNAGAGALAGVVAGGGSTKPFGGMVNNVTECTCGASTLLYIQDQATNNTLQLLVTPGTQIYANYNVHTAGTQTLGTYSPGGGQCEVYNGTECTSQGSPQGNVIEIGTGQGQ